MYRTHYHQAISEIVANIVLDRRDSVNANELGSAAFGISVNNMIGRFNELDRLQELARSAEEDREQALRLAAENKDLQDQISTLRRSTSIEPNQRNYKMENIALRALQQQSNKTIAMLQAKLEEKSDGMGTEADTALPIVSAPIIVGEQWKLAGRKSDNTSLLNPQQQMPGTADQQYSNNNNNNTNLGPGGFVMPGSEPPTSPVPHHNKQQHHLDHKNRPTHYLPPLDSEHGIITDDGKCNI